MLVAVVNHACRQPQYFRAMITVQRVLDSLRHYYWIETDEGSLGKADVVDAVTGHVIGERPKGQELQSLRHALLNVVRRLVVDPPTPDELDCIVLHLQLAPDVPGESLDVLQLLLTLLNDPVHDCNAVVAHSLSKRFGLGVLINLVARQAESFVVWAIKGLTKVLQVLANSLSSSAFKAADMEALNVQGWLCVLRSHLLRRRLTRDLYLVLLELLFGRVDTASVSSPIASSEPLAFRHVSVLLIILDLARLDERAGARKRCLEDLLQFLCGADAASRQNRAALVSEPGWAECVVKVLAACVREPDAAVAAATAEPAAEATDESLAFDLLSLLLQHCMMEGDWTSLSRVHVTLQLFGCGGNLSAVKSSVMRSLYARVARHLAMAPVEVGSACKVL